MVTSVEQSVTSQKLVATSTGLQRVENEVTLLCVLQRAVPEAVRLDTSLWGPNLHWAFLAIRNNV
jgi:hypothetical protein